VFDRPGFKDSGHSTKVFGVGRSGLNSLEDAVVPIDSGNTCIEQSFRVSNGISDCSIAETVEGAVGSYTMV